MTVIDSFFFMFEADGSKLKAGLKAADSSTEELGKNLQGADANASKLGKNLESLAITAGKALGAFFALHEIKKVTMETIDHTYAVAQQARAMNVNVESLSAWQNAVRESGGTAEGATQSMAGLRDKFVEMARFGNAMGPEAFMFEKLGLSAKEMHESIKDPMIALSKLSETFGKIDRTQALFLGQKLGLDQGTINLLMQGRRGLDEMIQKQKELGVVTQAQADAATKFKLKTIELGISFETITRDVTGELMPALTWLLDKVEKIMAFFHEHKAFAIGFFGALTVAVGAFAIATNLAALPFILMGAAVLIAAGAIALIVDDIWAFVNGGDSLIGRVVSKWPILGQIFKSIGEIIHMSMQVAMKAIKSIVDFVKGDMLNIFSAVADKIGTPFKILEKIITGIFKVLTAAPIAVLNWLGSSLASATGGKYDAIGASPAQAATENLVQAGKSKLAATNTPLNSMNSSTISNNSMRGGTTVQTGPITVNTQATSGVEVSKAIGDNLRDHLRNALNGIDDGLAI